MQKFTPVPNPQPKKHPVPKEFIKQPNGEYVDLETGEVYCVYGTVVAYRDPA